MASVSFPALRPILSAWVTALLLAATAGVEAWGQADSGSGLAATPLEPFHVRANAMEFKDWHRVSSTSFVIYTDVSADAAETLARECEMLAMSMEAAFKRRPLRVSPIIIVAPRPASAWHELSEQLDIATPAGSWAKPTVKPVTLVVANTDWLADRGLILVAVASALLDRLDLTAPEWFQVGVSQVFGRCDIVNDRLVLNFPQLWPDLLALRGWMPWGDFFVAGRDISASPDDEVRQRFQSQAAIFIRHLMVQRDARSLKKLLDWRAMQLSARIPTEKDFANHFGEKWSVWQSKLERYARAAASEPATLAQDGAGSTVAARELGYSFGTGSFSRSGPPRAGGALGSPHSFVFQFTPNERLQTFHRQELASKEVRELYLVAQTLRRRTPVAKATLAQLLRTGAVGPYLPELIAAACQWHGRPNEAVAFSNRLINAGVPNPWLYEFGARVRFDAFLPDIRSSTRLDLQAAIEIRALCEAALEREPRLSDAARMLAWTEALAPEVTPEAVAAADALYQRFKDEAGASELAAALALLQERNGNRQVALTLCRELVKSPQTSARALAVAQELLALEPVTKGR